MGTFLSAGTKVLGMAIIALIAAGPKAGGQDGWTELPIHPDTVIVYVSNSSGNDANSGLSPFFPVKSLERGKDLVRPDAPDRMLLKKGDSWTESFGDWNKGGLSQEYPMVIGAYGEGPRPIIRPVEKAGIRLTRYQTNHVAIVGLHFKGPEDPLAPRTSGITVLGPSHNVLIEDCMLEALSSNVQFQAFAGPVTDMRLRRSVIVDSVSAVSFTQGLFGQGVDGMLIEENVFDYNGWREGYFPRSQFNRNIYIQWDCFNVIFRGNITTRSSSAGVSVRGGGIVEDNLIVSNPIGVGFGSSAPKALPGGVGGAIRNNVILHGNDIEDWGHGWGIWASNIGASKSLEISGNLIAHESSLTKGRAFAFSAAGDPIFNTTIAYNIVHDWGEIFSPTGSWMQNNLVLNNVFSIVDGSSYLVSYQDNALFDAAEIAYSGNWYSTNASIGFHDRFLVGSEITQNWYTLNEWLAMSGEPGAIGTPVEFRDPERTVESYHGVLGKTASLEAFLEEARQQSRDYWRPEYTAAAVNAYIREGFTGKPPTIVGGGFQEAGVPMRLRIINLDAEDTVQWMKDGALLPGETSDMLEVGFTDYSHTGNYWVMVTDNKSSEIIGPVYVQVVSQLSSLTALSLGLLCGCIVVGGAFIVHRRPRGQ